MTGHEQDTDLQDSTPGSSGPDRAGGDGGMGISSERVGPTGPGQVTTDGVRDTSVTEPPADAPPEQSVGGPEDNPDGLEPKADYPSLDPRSS